MQVPGFSRRSVCVLAQAKLGNCFKVSEHLGLHFAQTEGAAGVRGHGC